MSDSINMDEIKDMMVEGEKIVLRGEIHPGIYWKPAAVLIFGLLIMALLVFEIGVVIMVAGLVYLAWTEMVKHFLLLVMTNKRVLFRYGVLQVDVVDMRFSRIESIELERMLPGYIMGYANVVVMGTGQRYVVIPYIGNAREFRRKFNELTLEEDDD